MILVAVRLWKPQTRLPWYLFALGQSFFVAGDVITYNYDRFFGTELPFPSVGDVFYLSVYPCLVVGILLLVRRGNPGGDRDSVIDSLIVAIGVGTISWVFLLSPLAHDSASTLIQKLTAMGYPVVDLILLTVVVRLAIGGGRRAAAFYLMAGAALALFVTDFFYSFFSVQGITYDNQTGYLEAGWATFYILWGAAALHGSMRSAVGAGPRRRPAALPWPAHDPRSGFAARAQRDDDPAPPQCDGGPPRADRCRRRPLPPGRRADRGPGPEAGTVCDPGTRVARRRYRARDRHQPGRDLRGDPAGGALDRGGNFGDQGSGRRGIT